MKPALFYALGRQYGRRPSLDNLMAVTSVKGTQFYGRDAYFGNPTHRSADDFGNLFRTEEEATSSIEAAQKAWDAHQQTVDAAQALLKRALGDQCRAVTHCIDAGKVLTYEGMLSHLKEQGVELNPGAAAKVKRRMTGRPEV